MPDFRTVWICLSLLLAAGTSLSAKTALVLHSYYKGYRWTDDENRGIESVLLPQLGI